MSILPDIDVISFRLGIPYASPFGHRGFTHSLVVAAAVAVFCGLFHRRLRASRLAVLVFAWFAMASHPLLDALTDGGLGVALFWPFSAQRYFLPWPVIAVSPIGVSFFSARGWAVLQSEILSVGLPSLLLGVGCWSVRKAVHALARRPPGMG